MKGECVRMFRSASLPQLSAQGCTKGSPRRGWVTGLVVHETALTPLPSPLATSTLLSGEPTSWLTDSWTLPYSPHFSVIRLNRSYRASYLRGFQNLPDSYPLEKSFLKELAISFPLSLSLLPPLPSSHHKRKNFHFIRFILNDVQIFVETFFLAKIDISPLYLCIASRKK